MLIIDVESNDIVERFPVAFIQQPISFSHRDHMYDNILIFTVQHPDESQGNETFFFCLPVTLFFVSSYNRLLITLH